MTMEETGVSVPTSRIIVKNLPKYITADRLQKHFASHGRVTDVRMAYTPNGTFRRFAFIGYPSVEEAKRAQAYFDRTFIDTSRIEVAPALAAHDPQLPRAWSRHSQGSSAFARQNPETLLAARDKKKQSEEQHEQLKAEIERKRAFLMSIYGENEMESQEVKRYLAAMKGKAQTRTWANDDEDMLMAGEGIEQLKPSKAKSKKKTQVEVKAVPAKRPGGEGILLPKVHVKFDDGNESDDLYEDMMPNLQQEDSPEEDEEGMKELAPIEDHNEGKVEDAKVQEGKEHGPCEPELIAETGRLFLRNLAYTCTEDDLRSQFERFGMLSEVHMPISRETKKPKGMAYIQFMMPEDAVRAYTSLDGTIFQGRLLHILPAADKPASTINSNKSDNFQSKKEEKLKATATSDHNWNSLFIRPDTVLEATAAELGVPKSALLTGDGGSSMATKLAIAETRLIQRTKAYLEEEGVQLDCINGDAERSDCLILVKNLPWETEAAELRRMFSKFGSIDRVILPPMTRSTALIEFLEASEARQAFRSLAYTKFKQVPLYLEWAPMGSLAPRRKLEDVAGKVEEVVVVSIPTAASTHVPESELPDSHPSTRTLHVTNLNFSTTEEGLRQCMEAVGSIRKVTIPTKRRGQEVLSLGFGFVEFESRDILNRALDELQGTVLDGHALVLRKSHQQQQQLQTQSKKARKSETSSPEAADGTKLVIRNIPFEANEKEVRDLFKSFGQVKRVRLPRRFNGQHRGFGFVEFLTHQEAAQAKQELAHTHLYGRHLVLEWAQSDEQLEEVEGLRERTRQRSIGKPTGGSVGTKASRVQVGDAIDEDE